MSTWIIEKAANRSVHFTSVHETSDTIVRQAIELATDKAISLLKENIANDSLYLLFEWNLSAAELNICITDASKTQDADESTCCKFPELAIVLTGKNELQRLEYTENVKFWLHDYLTVCTAFFNYSLVAIFHSSTRDNTELL